MKSNTGLLKIEFDINFRQSKGKVTMNFIYPDHLYEVNRQKIQRDRAFILKEEMMKPKSSFGILLNTLGNWMIAKGEQLHKRHAASGQINPLAFLQDEAGIFKHDPAL